MSETVSIARRDVCSVAQLLIDVAELIPPTHQRAVFNAGRLPERTRLFLKRK